MSPNTTGTSLAPTLPQDQMTSLQNSHTFTLTVFSKQELKTGKIMDGDFLAFRTCSESMCLLPPRVPCRS